MQKFKHGPFSYLIFFASCLNVQPPPLPRISQLHQRSASAWFAWPLLSKNTSRLASSTSQVPSAPPCLSWISPLLSQLPTAFVLNPNSEIKVLPSLSGLILPFSIFSFYPSELCLPLFSTFLLALSHQLTPFATQPLPYYTLNLCLTSASQQLHIRHLCWEVSWPVTDTGQLISALLGIINIDIPNTLCWSPTQIICLGLQKPAVVTD